LSDRLVVMFHGQFVYESGAPSEADLTEIGRHHGGALTAAPSIGGL